MKIKIQHDDGSKVFKINGPARVDPVERRLRRRARRAVNDYNNFRNLITAAGPPYSTQLNSLPANVLNAIAVIVATPDPIVDPGD